MMETTMFDDTLRNPWIWLLVAALVVFAMRADAHTITDPAGSATEAAQSGDAAGGSE